MLPISRLSIWDILAAILILALVGFAATKACVASFTHDESFSYLHYPQQSFMDLLSFRDWYTNNHILNSIGMKYSELLFGNSEFALRLPNVLLFIAFLIFGYRLVRHTHPVVRLTTIVLLGTNPLLTDLFGLARGYGLSCGFMVIGLFYFVRYVKSNKPAQLVAFHLAFLLATLSNFPLLTVYAALLFIYLVLQLLRQRVSPSTYRGLWNANRAHLLPLAVVAIVLYEPVRRVLSSGNLNFGGSEGFFADTVSHLLASSLHETWLAPGLQPLGWLVFAFVCIAPLAIALRKVQQRDEAFFEGHLAMVVTSSTLLCVSLIIVGLHLVVNADYPVGRFAMFQFPIAVLNCALLTNYLATLRMVKVAYIGFGTLAIASAFSFGFKTNLHSCAEWGYDQHTKTMMAALVDDHSKLDNPTSGVNLTVHPLFGPTANYYRITWQLDWLAPVTNENPPANSDYHYDFIDSSASTGGSDQTVASFRNPETKLIRKQ